MPHSTTKSHRTKRPDSRPNGKVRRTLQKEMHDKEIIQDLRVTKIKNSEHKERLVDTRTVLKTVILSANEKRLRALKKKLRKINDLIEKRDNEVITLDEQQQRSVDELDETLERLRELISDDKQL